jgi:hypothetical protein
LDEPVPFGFSNSTDFEQRFPDLAEATAEQRQWWRSGPGESRLGRVLDRSTQRVNFMLLADALGVAEFLVGGDPSLEIAADLSFVREARATRELAILPESIRVVLDRTRHA